MSSVRRSVPILVALAVVVGACGATGADDDRAATTQPAAAEAGAAEPADTCEPGPAPAVDERDLAYTEIPDVDPDRLSLDLAVPARDDGCEPAPVVVWVHGGGWSAGDRRGPAADDKRALFTDLGWAFASVDYRLSPRPIDLDDPDAVRYPDHNDDVAAAVAWVVEHAEAHGIDPERIALLGHSAGAGIVAGVATDPAHLERAGQELDVVACTVSLDTEAYDVARTATSGGISQGLYRNAFGSDPEVWEQASPIQHVSGDLAPFLVVSRGSTERIAQSQAFVDALVDEGVDAQLLDAGSYSHADVNRRIGEPGEQVVTPVVEEFLTACFDGGHAAPA